MNTLQLCSPMFFLHDDFLYKIVGLVITEDRNGLHTFPVSDTGQILETADIQSGNTDFLFDSLVRGSISYGNILKAMIEINGCVKDEEEFLRYCKYRGLPVLNYSY